MDNSESFDEKVFSNGDVYVGNFRGILPHGKGKYTWPDGTVYDGDWFEGKVTGKGHVIWPSGVSYEGDLSAGYLHGFGTLTSIDETVYRGSWRMNIQHGFGRKKYCNSDVYEGSWKEGVHEGSGKYVWRNGNTYIGNWKGGKMWGRGVMKWVTGDLYDGFWMNGFRHGSGCYRFADDSYYFGTWTKGLKDGLGTFYPPGSKYPSQRMSSFDSSEGRRKGLVSHGSKYPSQRMSSFDSSEGRRKGLVSHSPSLDREEQRVPRGRIKRSLSEKISVNRIMRASSRKSHGPILLDESFGDSTRDFSSFDSSCVASQSFDASQHEVHDDSNFVYEREYMQGVLIKERIRKTTGSSFKRKQQKKFHVKEKRSCVNFFDGHRSYYLMLNLQLGIRYTVGKITPVPMREVRDSDFGERARIRMYFPRKGSQFTPPHYSVDFYWKDYCPMVFRNLRELFKLDAAEYMMSICGDDGLRELSSPGKSGSIFYISHDDRFFIKTLKKYELKVVETDTIRHILLEALGESGLLIRSNWTMLLLKMLTKYYNHVREHENTLITKFFGVHQITLRGGKKVQFVVMGNMFCTELRIHRRFDLKGSTQGRMTNQDVIVDSTTLKDLDLSYEIYMDKLLRESLFRQLNLDCNFLESQQIIDYSLLLGIHFRAPEPLEAIFEQPGALYNYGSLLQTDGATSKEMSIPPKGLLLVTHEPSSVNTAPGPHVRGNTLKAFSLGDKEVDLLLPGTARLRVQLGVNMPAQANRKVLQGENDSTEIELYEVYDVVLYLGVIDILQEYNVKKKLEHACKSLQYDPMSISAIEPKTYAKRFITFLEKVFPQQP